MRIAGLIVAAAVAALGTPAIPMLAKDGGAPKGEEKATPSSCHA